MEKTSVSFSRPKDQSLEAFKAWIQELTVRMGGKTGTTTEEEWIASWKKFWGTEQPDQPK